MQRTLWEMGASGSKANSFVWNVKHSYSSKPNQFPNFILIVLKYLCGYLRTMETLHAN